PEAIQLTIDVGPFGARPLSRPEAQRQAAAMAASVALQPVNPLAWFHLGLNLYRLGRDTEAITALELAHLLAPGHDPTRQLLSTNGNSVAWRLATGPPSSRDPERAVPLARRAVALASPQALPQYRNTLGACLYRAGRHKEALAAFEANRAAGQLQGA